jgi:hypothetical protein
VTVPVDVCPPVTVAGVTDTAERVAVAEAGTRVKVAVLLALL